MIIGLQGVPRGVIGLNAPLQVWDFKGGGNRGHQLGQGGVAEEGDK